MRSSELLVAVWVIIFISGSVFAADINAPVEKKITIRSEIKRGGDEAWTCFLNSHFNFFNYGKCVSDAEHKEVQNNTSTDPYVLGLYFMSFIYTENKDGGFGFPLTPAEGKNLEPSSVTFWWTEIKKREKQFDISDAQVCEASDSVKCDKVADTWKNYRPPSNQ